MAALSTRAHGALDYSVGLFLVASPWLLGFGRGGAESWVPAVVGGSLIVWSLLTDYELGLRRSIDPKVHLWLDGLAGVLLAGSPWMFGFESSVWIPHLAMGILLAAMAIVTDTIPTYDRRGSATRGQEA
jgi:hypothetical protein